MYSQEQAHVLTKASKINNLAESDISFSLETLYAHVQPSLIPVFTSLCAGYIKVFLQKSIHRRYPNARNFSLTFSTLFDNGKQTGDEERIKNRMRTSFVYLSRSYEKQKAPGATLFLFLTAR